MPHACPLNDGQVHWYRADKLYHIPGRRHPLSRRLGG
jgi:hypothetical protein